MKKTLFLSAILGAALCSSAFATSTTISGYQENIDLTLPTYSGYDLIIFNTTGGHLEGRTANRVFTQDIQIGDGSETQTGLVLSNGYGDYPTFTGTVTGSGIIKKTGAGTNLRIGFTGDVTGYTGNIELGAANNFTLRFGAEQAQAASSTTATKGIAGTGSVTFTTGNNTLAYSYAAGEAPVYVTNEIIKGNNATSKVNFEGGANYILTKAAAIDVLTISGNSSVTLAEGSSLALVSDSSYTVVSETARTSGNGFGSAVLQKDFGSSLVNNGGTITLNGHAATFEAGVLSGTGASFTYYINNTSGINFAGAKGLVVNVGGVTLTSGVDNLDSLTATNGTTTLSNTAAFHGNLLVTNGATVRVGTNDKLAYGNNSKGKSLTVEADSTLDMQTNRFSMGYYTVKMKGGEITGVGETNNGAIDFHINRGEDDAIVATGGVDSTISAKVRLREAINVNVDTDAQLTMSGEIMGGSGFTKKGEGTLTLSHADNTFTGNVTVAGGKLLASAANTLGSGSVTISGGELSLSARQNAASYTVGNGGTLSITAGGADGKAANGITVNAGGTLLTTATDTLGYIGNQRNGHPTSSVTLGGSDASVATWTMTYRQTLMGTALTLNGNTLINTVGAATTDPAKIDFHSESSVAVTGTNNKISVPLLLNGNMTINTGDSAANVLTLTGAIGGNNHTIKVAGAGHLDIGASLTNVTIDGTAALAGATRITMDGTVTLGNLSNDLSGTTYNSYALVGGSALNIAGAVDVTTKSDGTTNDNNRIGMSGNALITVKNGGSLTAGDILSTGSSLNNASIVVEKGATLTSGRTLANTFTNNGVATITGSTELDSNKGSGITNLINSGTLTFSKTNTTVTSLTMNGGSITLGTEDDHKATLTTTNLTVNAQESGEAASYTINADLVVNGGTITFADNTTLTMGCSVEIGTEGAVTVVLTQDMVDAISIGDHVVLFTDVESATLGSGISFIPAQGATLNDNGSYLLMYDEASKTIYVAPEPATATLSLLALAGLCARRRRH